MPEETKDKVVEETVTGNPYDGALNTALRLEYEEKKAQYKAARNNAKTVAERKVIMKLYQDDLIDLCVESRILTDWDLNSALNQEINSITRRVSTGSRGW